ncbi:MAG: hypothetical protein Q8Q01_01660 [archaeon]|nr:hypothetical protein [archaeon]
MHNPEFIGEKPVTLSEVAELLKEVTEIEAEVAFRSTRAKDFVENFSLEIVTVEKREELLKKLQELNLTRLKEEHFVKIIDFLPKTVDDLKTVFQAYPLSLPKKDQESIVDAVKAVL